MRKHILTLLLVFFLSFAALGQIGSPFTLNAGGGWAHIGSAYVDWSVGEMTMVKTFRNSNGILTQGVLQPLRLVGSAVNDPALSKQLHVFPNPASTIVFVRYQSAGAGTLSYRLMDVVGKVIRTATENVGAGTATTSIDVSGLACATYMLEVSVSAGEGTKRNIYKIQKNK